jgi:hypothetical protein
MKKPNTAKSDLWDLGTTDTTAVEPEATAGTPQKKTRDEVVKEFIGFDMEGLMTDFPTARDLERFVYDQTGLILNLKGRANKLKYQVALDTLNGKLPAEEFLTTANPYLDKTDLVPEDPLKPTPAPSPELASAGPVIFKFDTPMFPHPDPDWKAQGQNCHVTFKKYADGCITYEILGPIAKRAVGEKVNKFGKLVPEKFTWVDPRTGEQVIKHANGTLTPLGTRLRGFMKRQRINNTNMWDVWIDRDFVLSNDQITDNPWGE